MHVTTAVLHPAAQRFKTAPHTRGFLTCGPCSSLNPYTLFCAAAVARRSDTAQIPGSQAGKQCDRP